jgi:hypothetical protein
LGSAQRTAQTQCPHSGVQGNGAFSRPSRCVGIIATGRAIGIFLAMSFHVQRLISRLLKLGMTSRQGEQGCWLAPRRRIPSDDTVQYL